MHMALLMLGLVPLPICRGIVRDLVQVWPGIKNWLPVDEFDLLHRQLGTLCMLYIYIGAIIWIFQMATDCNANVPNACLAFDAAVIETFDPIENVVMLRLVVWPTWFFILPLTYFARAGAPSPLHKLAFVRRWWFEICMCSHIIVAIVTLMIALVGRKEVFYPVILSWWFYIMDRVREYIFFTRRAHLRSQVIFADAEQRPAAIRISLETRTQSARGRRHVGIHHGTALRPDVASVLDRLVVRRCDGRLSHRYSAARRRPMDAQRASRMGAVGAPVDVQIISAVDFLPTYSRVSFDNCSS